MNNAQTILTLRNLIEGSKSEFSSKKKFEAFSAEALDLLSQFETRGTKSGGSKYPNIERNGVEYKWCKRHQQYEELEQFFFDEKKGRHHPECRLAKEIWVNHGKTISKLERALTATIADGGDIKAAAIAVQEAKDLRAGHDYDRTGTEEYTLPAEEA